ncbi:MAG TPA: hypothetical protein VGI97_00550 [Gemmatimonadaceae bacterium]|jgi:hypothetical protein
MSRYAENTSVPADRSRAEIDKILTRYGASGFGYSWERREVAINPVPAHAPRTEQRDFAAIVFQFKERRVRLDVPMPTAREAGTAERAERATRQRWRALLLVIKAKLEAVESGISTLEQEFLAHVVTESGRTIGEIIIPQISEAVRAGRLLPAKGSE